MVKIHIPNGCYTIWNFIPGTSSQVHCVHSKKLIQEMNIRSIIFKNQNSSTIILFKGSPSVLYLLIEVGYRGLFFGHSFRSS